MTVQILKFFVEQMVKSGARDAHSGRYAYYNRVQP